MSHNTDIAVIGAGPVGLFAVFEAGMLKMQCHVIDALDFIGGQCTALYPEKPIYDIPAHPAIDGQDLIKQLEAQIAPFNPEFHLGQRVESMQKLPSGKWQLTTSNGTAIEATAVIIAAGCGAFGPNRPPLEGIEAYEGNSVHYMVGKKEALRGKRVVIAGGGDSAVDWALALADIASHLAVVHRRPKFRCAPESASQLHALVESGKIELVTPYQLSSLEGENGQLHAVHVSTLDGESKRLDADILLPFFGLSMNLGPIADWGLDLEKKHLKVDPATLQTNLEGVYAIGDIIDYPGKLKLILSGFSEGAMATHDIYRLVYPDTALHFEYSTTMGVPG